MSFCYKTAPVWLLLGRLFFILKIVIPLIIIIIGIVDFSKAAFTGEEKEVKKSINMLLKRFIIGVVIFLIPTVIRILFDLVAGFSDEMKKDAGNCMVCITSPKDCDTSYDKSDDIFK